MLSNQKGVAHILIIVAAVGVLIYILISNTFSFRDSFFNFLFPKPSSNAQRPTEFPSVPDEIVIKFKPGISTKGKANTYKQYGLTQSEHIPQIDVIVAKVSEKAKNKVIQALSRNPRVEYVEPNYLLEFLATPNDSYYANNQWNLTRVGSSGAWDISKGSSSTVVAVVDSGVNSNHPDLVGKIVPGYNFLDSNTSDTNDLLGHGTIVSGIIGAATNNSIGIASLGWNTPVMPLRAADAAGYLTSSNMTNGVLYAVDHGAKVVNISAGGDSPMNNLQDAINLASSRNVVVVASAGNSGTCCIKYPAAGNNVIAVGATGSDDTKASFSSVDDTDPNTPVALDVVAPGYGVPSTSLLGSYSIYSGTSFSAPAASALSALILDLNPGLTTLQVTDIITSTARDLGDVGWDNNFGFGRIQADAALQKARTFTAPTPDTTAPNVNITSPTSGSTLSGIVDITADASDNNGVTKVEFYINGQLLVEDNTSPYLAAFDTTLVTNGSKTITAKAYDLAGNAGTSSSVSITVSNPIPDTTVPIVTVTYPNNGETVSGNAVNIVADATDNVSVSSVSFFINEIFIGEDNSAPYSVVWDSTQNANASYAVSARAIDSSANIGQSSNVTINVNNSVASPTPTPLPTVNVTPTPVPTSIPTNPPANLTISNVSATSTSTSLRISWTTNLPSTSMVSYGESRDNLTNTTVVDTNLTTNHVVVVNNLKASTRYFYKVHSRGGSPVTEVTSSLQTSRTKSK